MFGMKLAIFAVVWLVGGSLAQSPDGDIVGKVMVGYQGWFLAKGDNSPINHWVHWSQPNFVSPSPNHVKFELWPDVSEYSNLYITDLKYANGQNASLFSSWDNQTVDTHVKWMSQYGIDVCALQRFRSTDQTLLNIRNGIADRVRRSCEKYNRKFIIMFDLSDISALIPDLNANIRNGLRLLDSSAYARQNGKPVLAIWGMGFTSRPNNPNGTIAVLKELKKEFYVIGGVPAQWQTLNGGSHPNYKEVYDTFDMIQPWTVGVYNSIAGAQNYENRMRNDLNYCKSRGIDYQPTIFPGSAWSNWMNATRNDTPRLHGDFMWRQWYNVRDLGIRSAYVAMFDEFDEGTAVAKSAETKAQAPSNQYFLTLDEDGVRVSSDFYLREIGDGRRMMLGQTPLVSQCPTPFFPAISPQLTQILALLQNLLSMLI